MFIHQRRAEILTFTNDGRIGHAHQLIADFNSNVFKRALNDAGRDGVYLLVHG